MWWNFWSNWDIFDVQNLLPSKFELAPIVRPWGRIFKIWKKIPLGKPTRILKTLITCQIIITRRFFYTAQFFRFFELSKPPATLWLTLKKNFLLKIGSCLRWTHWAQNERNLRLSISKMSYRIQNPPLSSI
jgi:hypothetical protein